MDPFLRITLLQSQLHWEAIDQNLDMFSHKLEQLPAGTTDLIVLPEMFTTGFSMNTALLAETMDGKTVKWMQQIAQQQEVTICGSAIIEENGAFYNRLLWVRPDGTLSHYDKRHCFTLAGEHDHFQPGHQRLLVECKGWTICPLICYDLRFPVWSRYRGDYDALIYVANWPDRRNHAWKTLLNARAIENQSYTIGVNRVGVDEKGHYYSGDSAVIDYSGNILYQMSQEEDIFTVRLSRDKQQAFREKLAFLEDRDNFEIH